MKRHLLNFVVFLTLLYFLVFAIVFFEGGEHLSEERSFSDVNFLNVYSYEGFFDKDENLYYGVTRNGKFCRLFIFDLETEKVLEVVDIEGALGSWSILKKEDIVYIGTYSPASLYSYDLGEKKLELILTLEEEEFIWSMTSNEKFLYIGTYPNARVYLYDFNQGQLEKNFIEIENSKYVRSLEFYDKYLFIGLGPQAKFVIYDTEANSLIEQNVPLLSGESFVYGQKIIANYLFVFISPSNNYYYMDLDNFDGKNLILSKVPETKDFLQEDFELITSLSGGFLLLNLSDKNFRYFFVEDMYVSETFLYGTEQLFIDLFLGIYKFGVDYEKIGEIEVKPQESFVMSVSKYDENLLIGEKGLRIKSAQKDEYNYFNREAKGICVLEDYIFVATYAPAYLYKIPVKKGKVLEVDFDNMEKLLIGYEQNRPLSIECDMNNDIVAIGSQPNYGKWGGALTIYDVKNNTMEVYRNIVENHNVRNISFDSNKDSSVLYFTTVNVGGNGTEWGNEPAFLVKFDYLNKEILYKKSVGDSVVLRDLKLANNFLVISNEKKEVHFIEKENGSVQKSFYDYDIHRILLTEDGLLFLYNSGTIYKLKLGSDKIEKMPYKFENLYFLEEIEGQIYYFELYEHGVLL